MVKKILILTLHKEISIVCNRVFYSAKILTVCVRYADAFLFPNNVQNQKPTYKNIGKIYYIKIKYPNPSHISKRFGYLLFGAGNRNRTCMKESSLEPESSASASSAIPAYQTVWYSITKNVFCQ